MVGDDIAWLRADEEGQLRAINPENGFFGVAPGTSWASNPVAMQTIFKDTIFRHESTSTGWQSIEEKDVNILNEKGSQLLNLSGSYYLLPTN